MKNILIVGNIDLIFIRELIEKFNSNSNYTFDLLAVKSWRKNILNNVRDIFLINKKITYNKYSYLDFLKTRIINTVNNFYIVKNLKRYDVINIHYVEFNCIKEYLLLRKKTNKLIVSIYGYDFMEASPERRKKMKALFNCCDFITFTNEKLKKDFTNYYNNYYSKAIVLRFGLKTLDFIDKVENDKKSFYEKFNFGKDKIKVVCGYSSSSEHQHEQIINIITKLDKRIRDKIIVIFPMTYGNFEYRKKFELYLKNKIKNVDYVFLRKYLNYNENALLRKHTDIMINLIKSDQLSGSMQEMLFSENIVITGKWLPYDTLYDKGIFMIKVDKVEDLSSKLEFVIENLNELKNKTKKNKEIISDLSKWENNIQSWINLYSN